ncbi:hypothetical protein [Ktedonospora formicarum]|uniref:Uncharacterized protein n=1 Tax=Ktedonospora formicarum TaxID=2778364 RepID=A0A8J3I8C1_9CHLR|nr:hypothetical protein [Ktedonospora formicarum]GHO47658.1 hypothetical protein KSX_58210 [Ktedonospora formicarum]
MAKEEKQSSDSTDSSSGDEVTMEFLRADAQFGGGELAPEVAQHIFDNLTGE